jgi:hypothetical protein
MIGDLVHHLPNVLLIRTNTINIRGAMKNNLYGKRDGKLTKAGRAVSLEVSNVIKGFFERGYCTREITVLINEEAIFVAACARAKKLTCIK